MTTLIKITNNNISANPNNLTKISSSQFPVAGVNIRGYSSFQNGCEISSNHIFSSGQTYTDGMSFGSQISFSATKNDICGFINNGIITHNTLSNIGIISNNNISRGETQKINSFISGELAFSAPILNNSSALIVDNYFSHDTVNGVSNWQDVVKSRGSGWTVERNKNQTEEVTIDSSVGEKYFSNDPIPIILNNSVACYFNFKNRISSDNGIVKFTVDNSIKKELSAHIALLYSTNQLYKWGAWIGSSDKGQEDVDRPAAEVGSNGPFYLFTDSDNRVRYDVLGLPIWYLARNVAPYFDTDGIEWIEGSYNNDSKIPYPYYVVKNGTCNLATLDNTPTKIGTNKITDLLDNSIYRIYNLIKDRGQSPIRCKIFGSNAGNDGVYEIDPNVNNFLNNLTNSYIQIKRIIGIPYPAEEYKKETYDLSNVTNYFNWSINFNEILPSNVFVTNSSCDLNVSQETAGDALTYALNLNNRKIKITATSAIGGIFSEETSLYDPAPSISLNTATAKNPLIKINIQADLPAVADYREVDVSNLKIRYKW
jgi:hypothetical protein